LNGRKFDYPSKKRTGSGLRFTIKHSLDGTNTKGQIYALIPIVFIGRVEISMVIALTQTERVLSNGLESEECLCLKEIYVVVVVIP